MFKIVSVFPSDGVVPHTNMSIYLKLLIIRRYVQYYYCSSGSSGSSTRTLVCTKCFSSSFTFLVFGSPLNLFFFQ